METGLFVDKHDKYYGFVHQKSGFHGQTRQKRWILHQNMGFRG